MLIYLLLSIFDQDWTLQTWKRSKKNDATQVKNMSAPYVSKLKNSVN